MPSAASISGACPTVALAACSAAATPHTARLASATAARPAAATQPAAHAEAAAHAVAHPTCAKAARTPSPALRQSRPVTFARQEKRAWEQLKNRELRFFTKSRWPTRRYLSHNRRVCRVRARWDPGHRLCGVDAGALPRRTDESARPLRVR